MKRLSYFALLSAFLCLAGVNKALALDYNCVITNISVEQSDAITFNRFKLTINQSAVATASGNTPYSNSIELYLDSDDRTIEGSYSSASTATNKINRDLTSFNNGSREIRTNATSTFVINKVSDGVYAIRPCTLCLQNVSTHSGTYNYRYAYADKTNAISGTTSNYNFNFTPKYAAAPTSVSSSAISSSSATISWSSTESAWQYVCLPATTELTEELWTANAVNVNTKSVTVSGLAPATRYKFYVISKNATGTSVIVSKEFTTECATVSSFPWNEGFESSASSELPLCWQELTSGTADVMASNAHKHTGSNSMCLVGGGSTTSVIAIFPEFDRNISDLALSFWYKTPINDDWYTYGNVQVGYVTNASGFVATSSNLAQTSTFAQVEDITFAGAKPGYRMAIRFEGGVSNGRVYIDDINVKLAPSCNKP